MTTQRSRTHLACPPKVDPVVLRVSTARESGKDAPREAKRHTPEQIIAKLCEADGTSAGGGTIAHICQRLEISEQTFHRRRNQYGGMKASEAKRLKELELENSRLKKRVADLSLDNAMLKDVASGNW